VKPTFFFGLLLVLVGWINLSAPSVTSGNQTVTAGASQTRPLKLPLISPRIIVKKAERKLFLYSGGKIVRSYHVGLGLSPVGDKLRQGDRRTPEGDFYIFTKNDKSAFYLSLGISYLNARHAERGLRDGLITKAQYDSITRALQAKKTPP